MEKVTLQFSTLKDLVGFVDAIALVNYEVNRNVFQLSCTIHTEDIQLALRQFHATVLLPQVLL